MRKVFLFASMAAIVLSACRKDHDTTTKVYKGEAKAFQQGTAFTWYEVGKSNTPLRLAVAIDDAAMATLDRGMGEGGHSHHNAASLPLPPQAQSLPFTHALLDWNPTGHDPAPIYGLPHFDFHFYTTSEASRLAIPLYEMAPEKFDKYPSAEYLPVNYTFIPGGVPQMGTHWFDVTSPEFSGQTFTQTFIYGTYDGKVTFYEPMITEAFLKASSGFERSIPQPAKVEKPGWYPTKMRIEKTPGLTSVILTDFVRRQPN